MHAKTLPSTLHTNSEYINFQNMSFCWHEQWLTAVTSLARGEYLSPSCQWKCNFNDLTDTEYGNDADPLYQQSSTLSSILLLLCNIHPNISIIQMYHSLLSFKTFLTQLTWIMNKNYLFVQTGCISTAVKPFTLCTHKLFFLTVRISATTPAILPKNLVIFLSPSR